jgi:hypothetical protein
MKNSSLGKGVLFFTGLGLASGASGSGAPADSTTSGGLEDSLDTTPIVSVDSLPQGPVLPEGVKFMDENNDSINDFYQNPDGSLVAQADSIPADSTEVVVAPVDSMPISPALPDSARIDTTGACEEYTIQDGVVAPVDSMPINPALPDSARIDTIPISATLPDSIPVASEEYHNLFSRTMTELVYKDGRGEVFPFDTDGLGGHRAEGLVKVSEVTNFFYEKAAKEIGMDGKMWKDQCPTQRQDIADCAWEIAKDYGYDLDALLKLGRDAVVIVGPTSSDLEAVLRAQIDIASKRDSTQSEGREGNKDGRDGAKGLKGGQRFRAIASIYTNPGAAVDAFVNDGKLRFGLGIGASYNGVKNTTTSTDSSSVRYDNPLGFSERGSVIDTETSLGNLAISFPRFSIGIKDLTLTAMLDHYQVQEAEGGFKYVRNVIGEIQEDHDSEIIPRTESSKWKRKWSFGGDLKVKDRWGINAKYSGFNKKGAIGISYRFGESRNGNLKAAEGKRAARGN